MPRFFLFSDRVFRKSQLWVGLDPLDEDLEEDFEEEADNKQAGTKEIKLFLMQKMQEEFDGLFLNFIYVYIRKFMFGL